MRPLSARIAIHAYVRIRKFIHIGSITSMIIVLCRRVFMRAIAYASGYAFASSLLLPRIRQFSASSTEMPNVLA